MIEAGLRQEVRHDHVCYLLYCDFHIVFLYVRAESLSVIDSGTAVLVTSSPS